MFLVRRKTFPSYRLTISSKAAASPARAAETRKCSSSRTIVDGRGCGLDAVKVSKGPQNGATKPFSAMNIPLNIRPPIPYSVLDEGERERERDSEKYPERQLYGITLSFWRRKQT